MALAQSGQDEGEVKLLVQRKDAVEGQGLVGVEGKRHLAVQDREQGTVLGVLWGLCAARGVLLVGGFELLPTLCLAVQLPHLSDHGHVRRRIDVPIGGLNLGKERGRRLKDHVVGRLAAVKDEGAFARKHLALRHHVTSGEAGLPEPRQVGALRGQERAHRAVRLNAGLVERRVARVDLVVLIPVVSLRHVHAGVGQAVDEAGVDHQRISLDGASVVGHVGVGAHGLDYAVPHDDGGGLKHLSGGLHDPCVGEGVRVGDRWDLVVLGVGLRGKAENEGAQTKAQESGPEAERRRGGHARRVWR